MYVYTPFQGGFQGGDVIERNDTTIVSTTITIETGSAFILA